MNFTATISPFCGPGTSKLGQSCPFQGSQHLKSVVDVIFEHNVVVSILVVIAIVMQLCRCLTLDPDSIKAQEVYFLKVEQLCFLIICYSVLIQLEKLSAL